MMTWKQGYDRGRGLIFHLERVKLDRGGYVASGYQRGRYFGVGAPLFLVSAGDGKGGYVDIQDEYIRAKDRAEAKKMVKARYPDAKVMR